MCALPFFTFSGTWHFATLCVAFYIYVTIPHARSIGLTVPSNSGFSVSPGVDRSGLRRGERKLNHDLQALGIDIAGAN